MIADQLLQRLEVLHKRDLLHRDMKPDNCLLGTGRSGNKVYITDFGLVRDYQAKEYGAWNDVPDRLNVVGTARFASLRAHRGKVQSPQDDLESLSYMLVYFFLGKLPWQGLKAPDRASKERMILDKKTSIDIDDLCVDLPPAFGNFMRAARCPPTAKGTDYQEMRGMFHRAAAAADTEYDQVYDWTIRKYFEDLDESSEHEKTEQDSA
ncbi:casein kinase-like protein I isoform epsilon [Acrodontium crateriforme]|uniref:non-specific serine/threonine protein kinase n=1 Tax=Acrodontium crateriforme TaxID=150365 RepID=A0AAQ3M9B9_9PEZI|nr:casein kinase-like protein I isoform epsilon [Acrodontium crateriforme]